MKKLIATTSMFALMLATPALAQTSEMPANESNKPAVEQPSQAAPAMTPSEDKSMSEANAEKPAKEFSANASGQHWRASALIGQSVRNAANETVGDINDIVLSSDGSIEHVLVGVGGFLGLGEKVVALKFDELSFIKNADGSYLISTTATKGSLESAQEWTGDTAK